MRNENSTYMHDINPRTAINVPMVSVPFTENARNESTGRSTLNGAVIISHVATTATIVMVYMSSVIISILNRAFDTLFLSESSDVCFHTFLNSFFISFDLNLMLSLKSCNVNFMNA